MSVTPSSVTKVVPVVQQNIASFFAKKPQSEGIREITPAVVVGDRKALATKGDNVVLTDKPTKSAEKSALKAKAHADEDSEAEASYCPVTPAPLHATEGGDNMDEESVNRLVNNTGSPTVGGAVDDEEQRVDSDADADTDAGPGPTGGKPKNKKKIAKADTAKVAKPAATKKSAVKSTKQVSAAAAKKENSMLASQASSSASAEADKAESSIDADTDAGADTVETDTDAIGLVSTTESNSMVNYTAVQSENMTSPVSKRKRNSKASAKAIEAKEAAALDNASCGKDSEEEDEETEANAATIAQTPDSATQSISSRPKTSSSKKTKKEVAPTFEELPEVLQVRIQIIKEKMAAGVEELLQVELFTEHADNDLEVDAAVLDLVCMMGTADAYAVAEGIATKAAVVGATITTATVSESLETKISPFDMPSEAVMDTEPVEPMEQGGAEQTEVVVAEAAAAPIEYEDPGIRVEKAVKKIIARTMQGSSDPVSRMSVSVSARLDHALQAVEQAYTVLAAEAEPSELVKQYHTLMSSGLTCLLGNAQILEDEIKSLAERVAYGVKDKNALAFEDNTPETIWRWEVMQTSQHFSKATQTIVREAKATRKRYGSLLRACFKVNEQLSKSVEVDEAKVSKLEETMVKAMADISKAKDRKTEFDLKKKKKEAAMMVDKAKKDQEKEEKKKVLEAEKEEKKKKKDAENEEKRKEKEAESLKKKEESAKKKEEQQQEKDRLAAEKQAAKDKIKDEEEAKLSKQKNLMMNMFGSVTKSSASTAASSSAARVPITMKPISFPKSAPSSAQKSPASILPTGLVDLTHTSSEEVATTMEVGGPEEEAVTLVPEFDTDAFIAAMKSNMSIEACMRHDSPRIATEMPVDLLKTMEPRPTLKLRVTMSAISTGFGQEGYAELCDVSVDGFMRTFSFCDDHKRPAYFGTRSKTSGIITGRTPFAEDHNLVNYDYDSEDEYDEEADGEDIAESDDEAEEGDNDLEYDEFFLHDNDFGSDADSDGEAMAAVAMKSRMGEEKIGLRFLRDENGKWQQQSQAAGAVHALKVSMGDEDNQDVMLSTCAETEKDVTRLRNYGTIVFANARAMPFLGWSEAQPQSKKSSKDGKSKSESEDGVGVCATDAGTEAIAAKGEGGEKKSKKVSKIKADPKPVAPKNIDGSLIPPLVKMLHGNKDGLDKLVSDFCAAHANDSCTKANVLRKIKEIAEKKKSDEGFGSIRWVVNPEAIASSGLTVGVVEEGEGAAVFDITAIAFTPPRVKRARPVKEPKAGKAIPEPKDAPAPKSARLRGDKSAVVKELGAEWWPDKVVEEQGGDVADADADSELMQDDAEAQEAEKETGEEVEEGEKMGVSSPVRL